ncbi:MAG: V-type ATP synthase subunit F [Oscillospiraceae bacterium]
MSTVKVAAVGEHSSVILFHTAGVRSVSVENAQQAEKAVNELIRDGYEIIFLTEGYVSELSETIERYRRSAYPLILPVPERTGSTGYSMKKITDNMEKAIGTNIFDKD